MYTVRREKYLPKIVGATKNNISFNSVCLYSAEHNSTLLKVGNTRHFHNPKKKKKLKYIIIP